MKLSWDNIIESQGFGITLTGMLVVFSGLALISLFIARLPNLLALFDRLRGAASAPTAPTAKDESETGPDPPDDEEVIAALTLVLHLEMERAGGDRQRITIRRRPGQGSIWNSAGRMRSLSEGGPHA